MGTQMTQLNQVITTKQYFNSVSALIKVARMDTSASRAAAQVLLSAYNGQEWQLNVTDLCFLDPVNMSILRGKGLLLKKSSQTFMAGNWPPRSMKMLKSSSRLGVGGKA